MAFSLKDKVCKVIDSYRKEDPENNVVNSERLLSIGSGIFITINGITKLFSNPLLAMAELGVGAMLLDRGITGHCVIKEATEKPQDASISTNAPMSTAETAVDSTVAAALGTGNS